MLNSLLCIGGLSSSVRSKGCKGITWEALESVNKHTGSCNQNKGRLLSL